VTICDTGDRLKIGSSQNLEKGIWRGRILQERSDDKVSDHSMDQPVKAATSADANVRLYEYHSEVK